MRKLFVLFLLVALVPFTVGCNGLWDFDDDDDTVATSEILVDQAMPAANFASANAIADYTQLTYELVIGGQTYTFAYKTHTVSGDKVIITFYRVVPTASYATEAAAISGKSATANVKLGGTPIVSKSVTTPTLSTTPTTTPAVIPAVINVVDVIIPASATGVVSTFQVTAVTYGGNAVSQDSASPTIVTDSTPLFSLTFTGVTLPAAATDVTFTLVTKSMTTGKEVTLTATDLNYIKLTDTTATIALKASPTQDEELVNGATYSVLIKSAKFGDAYLALPGAYYIKKM